MCKNCLYRKNCQFLAKHKNAVVENCTAFKSEVEYIANIKSEAIKEFAEKLKQKISKPWYYLAQIVFVKEDIDELVRETVGKNDARNIIQR